MNVILATLMLAAFCGMAYRYGGSQYGQRWVRPMGVMLFTLWWMVVIMPFDWSLVLCAGLLYGSSTTYWSFVNKILPIKDKDSEYWWNYALHGFFIASSILPYIFFSTNWQVFLIRCALCAILIPLWRCILSKYFCNNFKVNKAVSDECGTGVIIMLTMPILLI